MGYDRDPKTRLGFIVVDSRELIHVRVHIYKNKKAIQKVDFKADLYLGLFNVKFDTILI